MSHRVVVIALTQSYRAGAFIDAGRRLGVPITIASERPQALAALNPDGHLVIDPGDPVRAVETLVGFARRMGTGAVLAADDEGADLAARARESLGLPGPGSRAVQGARDKLEMRRVLREHGIPGPGFVAIEGTEPPARAATRVKFPCVLKPRRLSASRGVMRANDPEEFVRALRRLVALLERVDPARPGGDAGILAEDYIPGAEVAVEGLMDDGRFRALAIFDKPDPLEGPYFEETIYVTPSRRPSAAQAAILGMTARMADALEIRDGPIHAELRVDGERVMPLEIAARSIGGLCSRALRFGGGHTLEEVILGQALGLAVGRLERETVASGVMMVPIPRAGTLREVRGVDAARAMESVEDVRITIPVGDALTPLPGGNRYLGFVFARAATPAAVEAALRSAHAALEFRIEEPAGGRT